MWKVPFGVASVEGQMSFVSFSFSIWVAQTHRAIVGNDDKKEPSTGGIHVGAVTCPIALKPDVQEQHDTGTDG